MANSSKGKGDRAELEIGVILTDLLGFRVRRKLGAGRADDTGDMDGIPDTVLQVAWWPKKGVLRAVREKPVGAEQQRINAGATFAASAIRLFGGVWRIVLTPEQFSAYVFNSQPCPNCTPTTTEKDNQ